MLLLRVPLESDSAKSKLGMIDRGDTRPESIVVNMLRIVETATCPWGNKIEEGYLG